jgi:CRISPR/Cas system-associated endonuclease Cas1
VEYSDQTPFKPSNGVLVLSGSPIAIRVDNGALKITCEGSELSYPRARCPLRAIVVTRPAGYLSFAACEWLRDVGVSLTQLDLFSNLIFSLHPTGPDQPALRRAQIAAATNSHGTAIMRELIRTKIAGQAALVLSVLGMKPLYDTIVTIELDGSRDDLLQAEALAAASYWSAWKELPLRFARSYTVPSHWRSFGLRQSPLSASPQRAITPGNAICNYAYRAIALAAAGLVCHFPC